jgi:nitroreductase
VNFKRPIAVLCTIVVKKGRIDVSTETMHTTLPVKDAIESRHSIRKFMQEPIPKDDLNEILELTSLAPSAWNLQPWRFHVITDSEMKQRLQEAAYGQQQVTSAPTVILVCSDMEDVITNLSETIHPGVPAERREQEITHLAALFGSMSVEERAQWGLTQTNIALGFLMLTAQGMGYATVPMLGFDQVKVKEILGLPEYIKFAAMLPIGRSSEEGYPHHRHSLERIVRYH